LTCCSTGPTQFNRKQDGTSFVYVVFISVRQWPPSTADYNRDFSYERGSAGPSFTCKMFLLHLLLLETKVKTVFNWKFFQQSRL
jgi:hypothetical protein